MYFVLIVYLNVVIYFYAPVTIYAHDFQWKTLHGTPLALHSVLPSSFPAIENKGHPWGWICVWSDRQGKRARWTGTQYVVSWVHYNVVSYHSVSKLTCYWCFMSECTKGWIGLWIWQAECHERGQLFQHGCLGLLSCEPGIQLWPLSEKGWVLNEACSPSSASSIRQLQIKLVASIHKKWPQTIVDAKGEMESRYANLH